MQPATFDKFGLICWLVITVFIGINGLFVNSDDLSEFVLWAFALPVTFLVWGNKPEQLFQGVAKGICWAFVPYFLICMVFFPITGAKYAGIWLNTNTAAMFLTAVCVCIFIELLVSPKILPIILYCLELGAAASLIFYTNSRGGLIATGISAVVTLILFLLREKNRKTVLLKIVCAALAILVMLSATVYISTAVSQIKQSIANKTTEVTESLQKPSKIPAAHAASNQEKNQMILNNIESIQKDRFSQDYSTLASFSTGRVTLWKAYASALGWLGHSAAEQVFDANGNLVTRSSHWTQLQFAYQYGILAGVFFLLLNIWSGCKAVWYVLKGKNPYRYFSIAVIVAYGVYSLIEANITTFGRLIIILYFFALSPLLVRQPKASADIYLHTAEKSEV